MNVIYLARNKKNGKCYVGKTKDYKQLKNQLEQIAGMYEQNIPFHNAIRLYGIDGFEFIDLASVFDEVETNLRINEYIEQFDTFESGYNWFIV